MWSLVGRSLVFEVAKPLSRLEVEKGKANQAFSFDVARRKRYWGSGITSY